MDLVAYSNIESLAELANRNGIDCPRLRGYRLMKEEKPVTDEFWKNDDSVPFWTPNGDIYEFFWEADAKMLYYTYDSKKVRWDRIHGKKRKILKTAIHNKNVRYKRQYDMWNKYAGKDGILYIHARIGGGNWKTYYKEIVDQPWFIEKVDDAFDDTYCDIYARIEVNDEID